MRKKRQNIFTLRKKSELFYPRLVYFFFGKREMKKKKKKRVFPTQYRRNPIAQVIHSLNGKTTMRSGKVYTFERRFVSKRLKLIFLKNTINEVSIDK